MHLKTSLDNNIQYCLPGLAPLKKSKVKQKLIMHNDFNRKSFS